MTRRERQVPFGKTLRRDMPGESRLPKDPLFLNVRPVSRSFAVGASSLVISNTNFPRAILLLWRRATGRCRCDSLEIETLTSY